MSSFKKHSADDLKTIIQNYQQGDTHAAEQLRQQFYPLIYKLSHRHSMYSTFGEDAENIAWLLFYEFMYSYDGENFIKLPGLVKRFMVFRLINGVVHNKLRFDYEQLEDFDPDGELSNTLTTNGIEPCLSDINFSNLLAKLPSKQQFVLREIYLKGKSQVQVAKALNCTPRSIRNYKNEAVTRLKKRLKK